MKPKNRTLLVPGVCFAVVFAVAIASIFYLSTMPNPPSSLPIPAGTEIRGPNRMVPFRVEGAPADLVGAWYAPEGGLFWVWRDNGSPESITPLCGATPHWNGNVNVSLLPGAYVVGFAPNPNGRAITITEAIRLVTPSTSQDRISGMMEGYGCVPPGVRPPPRNA